MKKENLFVWLVSVFVLCLAVISFALSFMAVSTQATAVGMTGWLFVLMVDGAIIVFSLLRLVSTLRGYRALGWGLAVAIVASTALSVWFNVGSGEGSPQAVIMHSLPPIFLLVSFEAMMFFIHAETEHQTLFVSLQTLINQIGEKKNELQTIINEKQTELQAVNRAIETAKQTLAQTNLEIERAELKRDRMELTAVQKQIMAFISRHTNIMTYQELADEMGTNKSTIYQPARKLIDAGLVHKNGNGFEVLEDVS